MKPVGFFKKLCLALPLFMLCAELQANDETAGNSATYYKQECEGNQVYSTHYECGCVEKAALAKFTARQENVDERYSNSLEFLAQCKSRDNARAHYHKHISRRLPITVMELFQGDYNFVQLERFAQHFIKHYGPAFADCQADRYADEWMKLDSKVNMSNRTRIFLVRRTNELCSKHMAAEIEQTKQTAQ